MPAESPPTLRESLSSRTGIAGVALFVLVSLYAVFVTVQPLAVVYLASVAFLLWLLYRFVCAHERIAVAQERRAAVLAGDRAGDEDGDRSRPTDAGGADRPASGVAEPDERPDGEPDRE